MGRSGQAVAHRARAFGMETYYHNRHRLPPALENMCSARYEADLDKLVAQSDILTLHCPATSETMSLMDRRRFALMKHNGCLWNTSRGQLVDEAALIEALTAHLIAGAALDDLLPEPPLNPHPLAP